MDPAGETKMKKTLLALALTAMAMPLTFAAQAPASQPPADSTAKKTTKKHVKKSTTKKNSKTDTTAPKQ
jgi:hypothetical protein